MQKKTCFYVCMTPIDLRGCPVDHVQDGSPQSHKLKSGPVQENVGKDVEETVLRLGLVIEKAVLPNKTLLKHHRKDSFENPVKILHLSVVKILS